MVKKFCKIFIPFELREIIIDSLLTKNIRTFCADNDMDSKCFDVDDAISLTTKPTKTNNIDTTTLTSTTSLKATPTKYSTVTNFSVVLDESTQSANQLGTTVTTKSLDGFVSATDSVSQNEANATFSNSWIAAVIVLPVLLIISFTASIAVLWQKNYLRFYWSQKQTRQAQDISEQNGARAGSVDASREEVGVNSAHAFNNVSYELSTDLSTSSYDHLSFTAAKKKGGESDYNNLSNENFRGNIKEVCINQLYISTDLGDVENE